MLTVLMACAWVLPDHQGPGRAPSSQFKEWIAATRSGDFVPAPFDDGSNGSPVYCYAPSDVPVPGARGGCWVHLIGPVTDQSPMP